MNYKRPGLTNPANNGWFDIFSVGSIFSLGVSATADGLS